MGDRNYAEEQDDERDALASIFPDEFQVVQEGVLALTVHCEVPEVDGGLPDELKPPPDDDGNEVELPTETSVTLRLKIGATYPDDLPDISLIDPVDLTAEELETLIKVAQDAAEENQGMVMVFTLHSEILEWLEERNETRHTQLLKKIKDLADAKADAELAEIIKGTLVTKESFEEWRVQYMEELELEKAAQAKRVASVKSGKVQLTGKQLFLKDQDLKNSDADIKEGVVVVDASVFADLDELDLPDVEGLDD